MEELRLIIKEAVSEENTKIDEEELRRIIDKLLPDIDKLISYRVKIHLEEIGKFMVKKFGGGE
jgi:nucleoid DNA-binding protein